MKGKKVKGKKLTGNYATAYQGPKKIVYKGTGQSGGFPVPRYKDDDFMMIQTPDSPGLIKELNGGKLDDKYVICYPESADVDPRRAARAQAYVDYNGCNGRTPGYRKEMEAIYGKYYTDEFERLKTAKNGPSAGRQN